VPTGTDSKLKEPLEEGDSEVKGTLRSKLDALVASTRETNPELADKQTRLLNILGDDIDAAELLTLLGLPPSKPR
jgi:hypothetical protein